MNEKPSLKKEVALVMKREIEEEEEDAPATKFVKQEDVKQEKLNKRKRSNMEESQRLMSSRQTLPNLRGRHELRGRAEDESTCGGNTCTTT